MSSLAANLLMDRFRRLERGRYRRPYRRYGYSRVGSRYRKRSYGGFGRYRRLGRRKYSRGAKSWKWAVTEATKDAPRNERAYVRVARAGYVYDPATHRFRRMKLEERCQRIGMVHAEAMQAE